MKRRFPIRVSGSFGFNPFLVVAIMGEMMAMMVRQLQLQPQHLILDKQFG
jgi:hypothetical protein